MRSAALLLSWLLLAPPSAAHDFWIQPSSHFPATDERVAVQLMVGDAGHGEPARRDDARIVRFAMLAPAAASGLPVVETPIVGLDGHDPAGWVRPDTAGPLVLVYTDTPARIELPAAKFESYLREAGLDAIARQRAECGLSDQPAREIYSRCAKALLDVRDAGGAGTDASLFTQPVGLPLELVPGVAPFQLATGAPADRLQPLPLTLLLDGQPLAGAWIHAQRLDVAARPDETRPGARTDSEGRCQLVLPARGRWLIAAVHMRAAPEGAEADYESLWASLTFEVPPSAR